MLRWYDSWYRLVSGWYPDFWDAHFPKFGGDQTSVFEKIKNFYKSRKKTINVECKMSMVLIFHFDPNT